MEREDIVQKGRNKKAKGRKGICRIPDVQNSRVISAAESQGLATGGLVEMGMRGKEDGSDGVYRPV